MKRSRFTETQIISILKEAEVLQGQGKTIAETVKRLGIPEQTFYRWRQEYGGMRVDQARRLKELEAENARVKGKDTKTVINALIKQAYKLPREP